MQSSFDFQYIARLLASMTPEEIKRREELMDSIRLQLISHCQSPEDVIFWGQKLESLVYSMDSDWLKLFENLCIHRKVSLAQRLLSMGVEL